MPGAERTLNRYRVKVDARVMAYSSQDAMDVLAGDLMYNLKPDGSFKKTSQSTGSVEIHETKEKT